MKKIITLFCLMLSLFAQAQQNGVVEYMYIHRNNGLVDSVAVAEIDSVTFATPTVRTQYEAVDLGLSVKWATFNVGATKPEEYGGYYAWGETEEKEDYSWSTYKWCNGDAYSMTKYCTSTSYGTVDNKTTLEPEDDVAHVKWGGSWRMATSDEQKELVNNCTWTWTTLNGVNGYTVTGPNGNSIFLPAAGSRGGTTLYSGGDYWSSSLHDGGSCNAYEFYLRSSYYYWSDYGRCNGFSVRPVCGEAIAPVINYTVSVSSDENGAVTIDGADGDSATVTDGTTVTVTATANDGYEFIGWFVGDAETPVSTDIEYVFTVTESVVLVAKFKEIVSSSEYEAVDLGLPSGIKWATFNVGATKPEEYGGYYAWGETEEKEVYSWSTYKWCNGSYNTMTQYCINSSFGIVDNKTTLDPEDDVAHIKWGGSWRMPTKTEQDELRTNCTWTWTAINGVNGYTVTGPNGNSIFLPAAGNRDGTYFRYSGLGGYYRSSSLGGDDSNHAYYLYFDRGTYDWSNYGRYRGHSVRPVCSDLVAPVTDYTVSVSSDENGTVAIDGVDVESATVADGSTVRVTATANDGYKFIGWFVGDNETVVSTDAEYTFTVSENIVLIAKFESKKTYINGYEYIDLGLPSGIKWATCNVGATKPEEYGGYYAWGETEEKENYDWNTYKWCKGTSNTMTQYCINSSFGIVDNKTTLEPEDDVAHIKWGGSWRMPTPAELDELCDQCSWSWTTLNGVNGHKVTGPNGNSIFIPAAGSRSGTSLDNCGIYGYYWSSSLDNGLSHDAYYLDFNRSYHDYYNGRSYRYYGYSVRPVCE